jgi:hypothetical protein
MVFPLFKLDIRIFKNYCEKKWKSIDAVEYSEEHFSFVIHKYGVLTELFVQTVDEYHQTGILTALYDKGLETYMTFADDQPEGAKVFALSDLQSGFVLWLCACGICIIVFICEKMSLTVKRWVRNFLKNCLGLVLFLRDLSETLKGYH